MRAYSHGVGNHYYYPPEGGKRTWKGMAASAISKLGVKLSFVPEDRLGMGLVGSMDMTDNMMLRGYRNGRPLCGQEDAQKPGGAYHRGTGGGYPGRHHAGAQAVRRKCAEGPGGTRDFIQSQGTYGCLPCAGAGHQSSYTIYHLLNEQKRQGAAVICVGEDLDVLLELCDRILVLCGGRISGIVDGRTATKEGVGLMMTKVGGDQSE